MSAKGWPRPLWGNQSLKGNRWVKHIYTDEAGTSRIEPVAFVAVIIVDPDLQLRRLAEEIQQAEEEMIPESGRDEFYFHAKDVYGKYKKQFGWDIEYCNRVVERWLKIVYDFGLCPTVGWWPKETGKKRKASEQENRVSHVMAFALAMSAADRVIGALYPDEIASVYAEDVGGMRDTLQNIFTRMRKGDLPGVPWVYEINNVMQGVSFLKKRDSIFLQLADAVVYSFKRIYHSRPGSNRLYQSFWGKPAFRIGPDLKGGGYGRFVLPPAGFDEEKLSKALGSKQSSFLLLQHQKTEGFSGVGGV